MRTKHLKDLWNGNADAWSALSRAGYDVYRDCFNTPAFFSILPEINGLNGLDIGCGEGHNTRLLAKQGGKMAAIDISEKFIDYAKQKEVEDKLGIHYDVADASSLPFDNETFDFTTSFMGLMDIPDPEKALSEACRVLKPGGFLQFSIPHPCFNTPHRKQIKGKDGLIYAFEVGNYFSNKNGNIEEWIFSAAPESAKQRFPKFKVPRFTRTLSQWFKYLLLLNFKIECVNEPYPTDDAVEEYPVLQDAQVIAYFLHVRVRK